MGFSCTFVVYSAATRPYALLDQALPLDTRGTNALVQQVSNISPHRCQGTSSLRHYQRPLFGWVAAAEMDDVAVLATADVDIMTADEMPQRVLTAARGRHTLLFVGHSVTGSAVFGRWDRDGKLRDFVAVVDDVVTAAHGAFSTTHAIDSKQSADDLLRRSLSASLGSWSPAHTDGSDIGVRLYQ